MAKVVINQDERRDLLAAKERVLNRNKPADEARAQADKYEADARKLVRTADEFDRTGDIHDTAKVAENNARRQQADAFNRRAEAFRAQAKEADTQAADIIASAGSLVKQIGARLLPEWEGELVRGLLPLFIDQGRAAMTLSNSDFYTFYYRWNQRHHNTIVSVNSRAETVVQEIDNLLTYGIPDFFGCPFLESQLKTAEQPEAAEASAS